MPDVDPNNLPGRPGAPTPDVLWFYTNHDPFFFVGAMANFGYIAEAWKSMPMPQQIKPFIPPRPIPAYIGAQSSVGQFASVPVSDF